MDGGERSMRRALSMVKRKSVWIPLAAAALAVVIIATAGDPVAVKAVRAEAGQLRVVVNATTTSTVKSENEATLSAQRTGRVLLLPVEEGDRVRKGQLIAQLDLTEESVRSESTLLQSRATYEEAEKNYARMKGLFEQGMISQQDLDAVRRAYEIARSQHEAARADVAVTRGYSSIRAPFDGVVARKYAEQGELLLPGKQIVTLVDPERIYVLATIDEVDMGRLRIGLPVTIAIDAFPGETFDGRISRMSPIVTGGKLETRTADVWVTFIRKDGRIRPGMSADVEILLATLENVLSVPSQAVIVRSGKNQVYVISGKDLSPGRTGRAVLRPVRTGETNWSFTQITGGLEPGEFVITTPEAEGLADGATVRIEE